MRRKKKIPYFIKDVFPPLFALILQFFILLQFKGEFYPSSKDTSLQWQDFYYSQDYQRFGISKII